ncbi:U11/U12 small nuclear ribonucleoprotein 25 kDa protein isoform X1 [Magnolia sinica]|uniref:U11/U12 small nuclear ribonucleoprotein 25 kDa protein isoform X1 n=1 Tax=Magnolia sinica TaxID=86752 RepID=UPI002658C5AB|nr:U11/U12 small nuclear ribonucleoprotein 25 kDa protein isoform X1 [Magnolia sinica]
MESSNSSKVENSIGYSSSSSSSSSNALKKARLQSMLSALLEDPVLSDIPKKPSLSDVETLINLEMGSAMKISVLKMDDTSFDVAVSNSATVKDLKLAIKKKTDEMEQSQMGHRHISWRHVWANFCLSHHNEKLIDDNAILQDFGIRNSSQVHFVPCVVSRVTQRHSRRKKHRFFHGLSKRL